MSEEIIFSYSRKQAIEDGVLVDVTEKAQEAGFKIPVVITVGVHELCKPPEVLKGCQDYEERLWDVLWMAVLAFKAKKDRLVPFEVSFAASSSQSEIEILWLVFNEYEGFSIIKPEEY